MPPLFSEKILPLEALASPRADTLLREGGGGGGSSSSSGLVSDNTSDILTIFSSVWPYFFILEPPPPFWKASVDGCGSGSLTLIYTGLPPLSSLLNLVRTPPLWNPYLPWGLNIFIVRGRGVGGEVEVHWTRELPS